MIASSRPKDAEPTFDCAWRIYALQYAQQIQTLSSERVQRLFDALQLQSLCNVSSLDAVPPIDPNTRAPPWTPPTRESATVSIYVDAVHGRDSNNGSLTAPLQTIGAAVLLSRKVRPGLPAIVLRAGTFYLTETIGLTPLDSGLTISAYPGEQPVISGGLPLSGLTWKAYNISKPYWGDVQANQNGVWGQCPSAGVPLAGYTNSWHGCQAICQAAANCTGWAWCGPQVGQPWTNSCCWHTDDSWSTVPQNDVYSQRRYPAKNVWVASVPDSVPIASMAAMQVNGQRATLARYPDANPELQLFPTGYLMAPSTWLPPVYQGAAFNYTVVLPPDMADPARGVYLNYTVGIGGSCNRYTPPRSFWCSSDFGPQSWQPTCVWPRWQEMHLRSPSGLVYDATHLPNAPYKSPAGSIVHTWRPGHWYSWMFEVGSANDTAFEFSGGGHQGGEGSDDAAEWWIEGVLEELDAPNEFFFDPATRQLYFSYNSSGTPPPSEVVVPVLEVLFSLQGGQAYPVQNVVFDGLTFTQAAPTFMGPRGVPSGGDWALERLGALLLEGTEFAVVSNCLFTRLDGNAVFLSGYNRNVSIAQNEFIWLGQSAIASWGRSNDWDGTNGEQPRFTQIVGNFAQEIGIIQKQSSFYFQAESCQTVINNNIVFNIPRAAINFDDGFGGANEIFDNLLFNTCRESSDHGAFNSWDRMPYVTMVRDGKTPSAIPAFNDVHHNFIVANYAADGGCLDNDDGSSFYLIRENFCVYGGHKSDFDGHSKHSIGNLHAYPSVYGPSCIVVAAQLLPPEGYNEIYANNTCILGVAGQPFMRLDGRPIPPPSNFTITIQNNKIFVPNSSLVVDYSKTITFQDFQSMGYDSGSTISPDVPDSDTIIAWAKALLSEGMAARQAKST